jgi:hypothetical protein
MLSVYVQTVPAVVRRDENQVNFKMNNSRKKKNFKQLKQCVHAKTHHQSLPTLPLQAEISPEALPISRRIYVQYP